MTRKSGFSRALLALALSAVLLAATDAAAQTFRSRSVERRPSATSNVSFRRSLAAEETQIFELVNRERSRKNLGVLAWDDGLAALARAYSRQMAREAFFDHFDGDGNSIVERAERAGLRGWRRIGENLFFCEGYDRFDRLAVRGWMESPTHRENILDRKYNASGIGIAESRSGEIYITQVFIQR